MFNNATSQSRALSSACTFQELIRFFEISDILRSQTITLKFWFWEENVHALK